jgi:hypothetical protein
MFGLRSSLNTSPRCLAHRCWSRANCLPGPPNCGICIYTVWPYFFVGTSLRMSNARLVPTFYGCRSVLAPASTLPCFGLRTLVNFVGRCGSLSFIFYWIAVLVFAASAIFMKICPCIASRYSAHQIAHQRRALDRAFRHGIARILRIAPSTSPMRQNCSRVDWNNARYPSWSNLVLGNLSSGCVRIKWLTISTKILLCNPPVVKAKTPSMCVKNLCTSNLVLL